MKRGVLLVVLVFLAVVLASPARAGDPKKGGKMSYLVETTHTPEECLRDLDAVVAETPKLLEKVDWGCGSGVHKGWFIVSTDNEAGARNMLPTSLRTSARVIALNKYTADQIRSFHMKK